MKKQRLREKKKKVARDHTLSKLAGLGWDFRSDPQTFWNNQTRDFPLFPKTVTCSFQWLLFQLRAPGAVWVIVSQFLGKQALIITGGQKAASSRNLADPSRRQPQVFGKRSLFNNIVSSSDPPHLPPAAPPPNSCCSVASGGSLSSFKRQMHTPLLAPCWDPTWDFSPRAGGQLPLGEITGGEEGGWGWGRTALTTDLNSPF